jgi:hypothetical protein
VTRTLTSRWFDGSVVRGRREVEGIEVIAKLRAFNFALYDCSFLDAYLFPILANNYGGCRVPIDDHLSFKTTNDLIPKLPIPIPTHSDPPNPPLPTSLTHTLPSTHLHAHLQTHLPKILPPKNPHPSHNLAHHPPPLGHHVRHRTPLYAPPHPHATRLHAIRPSLPSQNRSSPKIPPKSLPRRLRTRIPDRTNPAESRGRNVSSKRERRGD